MAISTPLEIRLFQWTGDNYRELKKFVDRDHYGFVHDNLYIWTDKWTLVKEHEFVGKHTNKYFTEDIDCVIEKEN